MSYREIPGHSGDIEPFYAFWAERLPQRSTFVEVGVFFGRSLACMGELRPDLDLWAVDKWGDSDRPNDPNYYGGEQYETEARRNGGMFATFLRRMLAHSPEVLRRTHVLRCDSTAPDVVAVDPHMVFIDAGHDYPNIRADIIHWMSAPRIRILAGHDYQPDYPGVVRAVDELIGKRVKVGTGRGEWSSCWWVEL